MRPTLIEKTWDEAATEMRLHGKKFTNKHIADRGLSYIEWDERTQKFVALAHFELNGVMNRAFTVGVNTEVAAQALWEEVNPE